MCFRSTHLNVTFAIELDIPVRYKISSDTIKTVLKLAVGRAGAGPFSPHTVSYNSIQVFESV